MVRIGIVGLGGMGRGRLSYYARFADARVEAVADVRARALRGEASLAGAFEIDPGEVRWFEDYRLLAESGAVDAVDICLPTPMHRDATEVCLGAGLDVLCEKPMALSLDDCDAMIAASRSAGRVLMIAHCIRFWPEYQFLVDLVRGGSAGRLLSLRLVRQGPLPGGCGGWMCRRSESGGVLYDLHVHDLDYCQYLLGLPQRVFAQGGHSSGAHLRYDYVHTDLDYGDGLQVGAFAQWVGARIPFVARYEATLERAFVAFDSSQNPTLRLYRPDVGGPETPTFAPSGAAYAEEIAYFLGCVADGRAPNRCPREESRSTVALARAASASLERREVVNAAEWVA